MGFIGALREMRREGRMLRMSPAELARLDDEDLDEALSVKLLAVEDDDTAHLLARLTPAQRTYYALWTYETEVNNGGLCQYFVNSSRVTAPLLPQALAEVGAVRNLQLLTDFVSAQGIDLADLDSFAINDIDDFEEQCERYPFDDFDDAFYDLYDEESLTYLRLRYARNHMGELSAF